MSQRFCAVVVGCSLLFRGAPSSAEPKPPQVTIAKTAAADLRSGDVTRIQAALDEIRLAGKQGGTPFVATIRELLERGLPPSLAQAAIDTLADLEADASAVVAVYAGHRDGHVRQAAVRALGHMQRGPATVHTLIHALSDPDAAVRGLAAAGLGQLQARTSVGDLFLALDHRVHEAAPAIGMLCGAPECEALGARLGAIPFDVASAGVEQALFRADVPDDTKIKLVGRVRELGTGEANKFLRGVAKRWPANGSARLKQAIDLAVQATGG